MSKRKYKYMHTIDYLPAEFSSEDGQIVHADNKPIELCDTLSQIKAQRRVSIKNRTRWGYPIDTQYGHVKVYVEAPHA